MRALAIAITLALACTAPVPQAERPEATPTAIAVPAPALTAAICDESRQRELLRSFFDGYNARDHPRVLAAFGIDGAHLGGAGLGQASVDYYDNVDGDAVQLQAAATLRAYLERRWALNDRFDVDLDTVALNARFPNPTFSFRRTSDQGTYAGNAKFVCSGGRFTGVVTSSAATTRTECPETPAAAGAPTNANTASFSRRWYASGDRRIWASKPERFYVGGNKVLWERPTGEHLMVSGRPRGSAGPELTASVPSGYETFDYQASGIEFPVAGCWEMIARSGASELRTVVDVAPRSYAPPAGGCADWAESARTSWWVVTATVSASQPDRPGFVRHQTTVVRAWKGGTSAGQPLEPGHTIAVWQDALSEPILERGRSYVLFLALPSFGEPNVQYGLTRILCPQRTIIEVHGTEVKRPAGSTAEQWIWKGSASLSDVERELSKLGR